MKIKVVYMILYLLIGQNNAFSQQFNSVYFGVNIDLYYKLGKHCFQNNFPGIKAFVGFNSSNTLILDSSVNGSFNLGTSLTIYNKSLGNSLNLDFQDNQIDWTTNITFGGLWGEKKPVRHIQTINNVSFYNLQHRSEGAAHIGVNFIMNNHGRHQTNGSFSLTLDQFSMTYYNDGGPFFSDIGLGDMFDGYWTGGLMFYWHIDEKKNGEALATSFNRFEFTFDQFTGYRAQMFELLTIIGVNIPDYDIYNYEPQKDTSMRYTLKPKDNTGYDYNASRYNIRFNLNQDYGFNIGVIGSLRDYKKEVFYALQDIIHALKKDPIHPNRNSNRIFVGLNFNNSLWKKTKE